jgi:hypothetical protein
MGQFFGIRFLETFIFFVFISLTLRLEVSFFGGITALQGGVVYKEYDRKIFLIIYII